MSDDVAYPIFRSPDRAEALRVARQMVAFGVRPYSQVSVEAEAHTLDELRRLCGELPEARLVCWDATGAPAVPPPGLPDLTRTIPVRELPEDLSGAEAYLPLGFSIEDQPVGSVEDRLVDAVGVFPAWINWESLEWSEVPERGFYGEYKHAEVTLVLNNDSRELDVPADTHLVLVHIRLGNLDGYEDRLARHLAERIGREVIGPPQLL
ncbi:hypothetical protein [Streptomyces sp. R44]|uniref:Barstar (barnase inhibitor) domain-containing protein n=1 Tax=Streptomyces sp. R44 TaxID=3238633 RepID=A0AB39SYK1_9ACTN